MFLSVCVYVRVPRREGGQASRCSWVLSAFLWCWQQDLWAHSQSRLVSMPLSHLHAGQPECVPDSLCLCVILIDVQSPTLRFPLFLFSPILLSRAGLWFTTVRPFTSPIGWNIFLLQKGPSLHPLVTQLVVKCSFLPCSLSVLFVVDSSYCCALVSLFCNPIECKEK